jgi:lysozyme family protein
LEQTMTAENFQACLAFTLKQEGGRSDNPRDPGGRTNQGVIQRTYDAYRASKGQTPRAVYAMTQAERDEIYRREYWGKVTGNSLPPGVDLCVFDFAVNSGPVRALRAYAASGHGRTPADAIGALCSKRLSFLRALATWSTFGSGWGRRVAACEATALKMAGASLGDARDKLQAKKRGSAASAVIMAGAGIAAILKNLHLHWWETGIAIFVLALIVLAFIGKSRGAGARADVLTATIAELKTKRAALDQTTKAAVAQVASDTDEVNKMQQAIKTAEAAITELGLKPLEKK